MDGSSPPAAAGFHECRSAAAVRSRAAGRLVLVEARARKLAPGRWLFLQGERRQAFNPSRCAARATAAASMSAACAQGDQGAS